MLGLKGIEGPEEEEMKMVGDGVLGSRNNKQASLAGIHHAHGGAM